MNSIPITSSLRSHELFRCFSEGRMQPKGKKLPARCTIQFCSKHNSTTGWKLNCNIWQRNWDQRSLAKVCCLAQMNWKESCSSPCLLKGNALGPLTKAVCHPRSSYRHRCHLTRSFAWNEKKNKPRLLVRSSGKGLESTGVRVSRRATEGKLQLRLLLFRIKITILLHPLSN